MASKAQADADALRSQLPSQMFAERGADVVVINPGSVNIRIGLASSPSCHEEPHVVARLARINEEFDLSALLRSRKGGLQEVTRQPVGLDEEEEGDDVEEREARRKELLRKIMGEVEDHATSQGGEVRGKKRTKGGGGGASSGRAAASAVTAHRAVEPRLVDERDDNEFEWTDVVDRSANGVGMEGGMVAVGEEEKEQGEKGRREEGRVPNGGRSLALVEGKVGASGRDKEEGAKGANEGDEYGGIEGGKEVGTERGKEGGTEGVKEEFTEGEMKIEEGAKLAAMAVQEDVEGGGRTAGLLQESSDAKKEVIAKEGEAVAGGVIASADGEETAGGGRVEACSNAGNGLWRTASEEGALPGETKSSGELPEVREDVGHEAMEVVSDDIKGGGSHRSGKEQQHVNGGPVSSALGLQRILFGTEALRVPAGAPYDLRRPICRGHLNASWGYPMQSVLDDVSAMWSWLLLHVLQMKKGSVRNMSAVLVVPDAMDPREIKELAGIVLRDLGFQSLVVHQEAAAAIFASGVSTACVVNIGGQSTSIVCVEDGFPISSSKITLPFGGQDVSRAMQWVENHRAALSASAADDEEGEEKDEPVWPYPGCNPCLDSMDLLLLESLKQKHAAVGPGAPREAEDEVRVRHFGRPTACYPISLSPAISAGMLGLFFPLLLAPEEYSVVPDVSFRRDIDNLDDLNGNDGSNLRKADVAGEKAGAAASGVYSGAGVGTGKRGRRGFEGRNPDRNILWSGGDVDLLGIHRAIVQSVTSVGREDLHLKFFGCILLVGGTAETPGLVEVLESKLSGLLPSKASSGRIVTVLPNRQAPAGMPWKGGSVFAVLDFARDTWVGRDDWREGGVVVGGGRRWRDQVTVQSQLLAYCALAD